MTSALDAILQIEQEHPEAAQFLVEAAAYETLCDLVDRDRERIEADLTGELVAKNSVVRRELVRKFIDARLGQQDVEPLLQAAAHVTVLDYEISKKKKKKGPSAEDDAAAAARHQARQQRANDWWKAERRNAQGEWTIGNHPMFQQALDPVRALAATPEANPWAGEGQKWNASTQHDKARRVGQALALSGHPLAQAGAVASTIYGVLGPEAETVFGHSLRRTAYRYRGTERRPDPVVTQDIDDSNDTIKALRGAKTLEEQSKIKERVLTPAAKNGQAWAKITEYQLGQRDQNPDQRSMNIRADIATNYLLKKVPNLKNAELSRAAGKVPPSQGVLLDRDGDVVSQAVGFHGDHYIPFDLKNMKRLHGGQYVRTRAQGGPTTEDIYTGLLTGARQMSVVSNSGIFHVEFDPDLRGGRRYNDKARQMVKRYGELLQAVEQHKVSIGEIDPETKLRLRTEAMEDAHNDPAQAKVNYDAALKTEQDRQQFLRETDDDALGDKARESALQELGASASQMTAQQIGHFVDEHKRGLKADQMDNRYRKIQLDGEGYHRALKALQEEFPYFIRDVRRDTIEEFTNVRGLNDAKGEDARMRTYRGTDQGHVNTAAGQVSFLGSKTSERRTTVAAAATAETDDEKAAAAAAGRPSGKVAPGKAIAGAPIALDPKTKTLASAGVPTVLKNDTIDVLGKLKNNSAWQPFDSIKADTPLADVVGDSGKFMAWAVASKFDGDTFKSKIDALSASDKAVLSTTVGSFDRGIDPAVDDSSKEQAKALATQVKDTLGKYLALQAPFSGETDVMKVPTSTSKPIAFPEIVQLGHIKSNYSGALPAIGRKDPEMAKMIDLFSKDLPGVPSNIRTSIEKHERAVNDDNKPEAKKLAEEIKRKQLAWSFAHAQSLAWEEGSGKAPAPQAGANPQAPAPQFGFSNQPQQVQVAQFDLSLNPTSFFGRRLLGV